MIPGSLDPAIIVSSVCTYEPWLAARVDPAAVLVARLRCLAR
jgi:hypothetical protein